MCDTSKLYGRGQEFESPRAGTAEFVIPDLQRACLASPPQSTTGCGFFRSLARIFLLYQLVVVPACTRSWASSGFRADQREHDKARIYLASSCLP